MPRTPSPTRTKILETARTLFSSHGFENTTIDDIITASGITKGAFYHYFKSKEALCQFVIQQAMHDYQALAESIRPDASPFERLEEMLTRLLELNASGEWVNCKLMFRLLTEQHDEAPSVQYELNNFWQWYKGFYLDLVFKSRQAGQISTVQSPETQTTLLLAMHSGICALTQIEQTSQPAAELARSVLKTLQ
jgi:AcrR family transcriptional regulator